MKNEDLDKDILIKLLYFRYHYDLNKLTTKININYIIVEIDINSISFKYNFGYINKEDRISHISGWYRVSIEDYQREYNISKREEKLKKIFE